jgi:ATP-dependent Clp protease ATP-binding subunit ClpA
MPTLARRLSDHTKRILASAAGEAARAQSNEITPDHVLLGILACEGVPARALNALGVDLLKARTALGASATGAGNAPEHIRPSAHTARLIERAAQEAPDDESRIEPEHLLLALVRDPGTASALERLGITSEDVRAKLLETNTDR